MPWKDVKPMDQKILFVSDYLRKSDTVSGLCRRYGISRKTGYKWINRYAAQGADGLRERSRIPAGHPATTPYIVRQRVIELRTTTRLTPGARQIRTLLQQRYPELPTPATSTINKILRQAGLSAPRQTKKRYDRDPRPLKQSRRPNELWSVDFKGQFKLGNGRWCYPLTVMDDRSRYLLDARGQQGTDLRTTRAAFVRLFRRYGLPERIRSDNGTPFASRATAGLSQLSIWWIRLGICPERIPPGQPQQNGRHERMHRTLKQHAVQPARYSMAAQQRCFDDFRNAYNDERPHQALAMTSPASHYAASPRAYPGRLPEIDYPGYFEVRRVAHSGRSISPTVSCMSRICSSDSTSVWSRSATRNGRRISVSTAWAGSTCPSESAAIAAFRCNPCS